MRKYDPKRVVPTSSLLSRLVLKHRNGHAEAACARRLVHRGERGGQIVEADAGADGAGEVEVAGGDIGKHGSVLGCGQAVGAKQLKLEGDGATVRQRGIGVLAEQETDLDVAALGGAGTQWPSWR